MMTVDVYSLALSTFGKSYQDCEDWEKKKVDDEIEEYYQTYGQMH